MTLRAYILIAEIKPVYITNNTYLTKDSKRYDDNARFF